MRTKANKTNIMTAILVTFLSNLLLTGIVTATAETVPVPAGKSVFRDLALNVDDEVSGRITAVGGESNDINFTVLGPNNQVILPPQEATTTNFKFTASEKGVYRFIFDNAWSSVDRTVSFNYDVRHYWFGMPQEFVLMLIIVFVGVIALVAYAMASKR